MNTKNIVWTHPKFSLMCTVEGSCLFVLWFMKFCIFFNFCHISGLCLEKTKGYPFTNSWCWFSLKFSFSSTSSWSKHSLIVFLFYTTSFLPVRKLSNWFWLLICLCIFLFYFLVQFRPSSAYNSPYFTTNSGAPVWNNNSSLTVGTRGIDVYPKWCMSYLLV